MVMGSTAGLTGFAGADTEPNDDLATAELISPGNHSGVLNVSNNPNDLVDYYKFNVSAGQIIGFDMWCGNAETGSVMYAMYRPNGTIFRTSELLAPGTSQQLSWMTNNSGAGQWYIKAEGPNTYNFNLTLTNQSDAGVTGDAGDDLNTPRAIEPNETYSGQEGDDDIADYYSFEAKAGQSLTLGGAIFLGQKLGNMTLYGIDKQALASIDMGDPDPPPTGLVIKATGTYYIGVGAGNCEYLLNITLKGGDVPDVRNPAVTITSPVNGTTVGNSPFDIAGIASDDIGVAAVEVSLSGIVWWMANGTTSWDYHDLAIGEGVNTIYARATDYSGKTNMTQIMLAYVPGGATDTERPQVTVTSPANGTTLNASTFDLSGTASDNFGVFKVQVSLSAMEWWMANGTVSWSYSGLTIGEGINSIWVRAMDFAGNYNLIWIHLAYVPGGANDTERPQVTITSPENGTTLNVSTFDLSGTASDDYGVAKVEVSSSAIAWWMATGTVNWTYPHLVIGGGISSIWVKATDFAGNNNITWITLGYNPGSAADNQRPLVAVTSPMNGTTVNTSAVNLSGTASDDFGVFKVEVSPSAIVWWTAAGTTGWTYSNLTLGEGINSIWVKATDFAGNYDITWITLAYDPAAPNDTQKPNVAVISPANGTTVTSTTINLVGNATDNVCVFKVEISQSGVGWLLASGTTNWSYPGIIIGEGISSIWVKATDYAGNTRIIWVTLAYFPGGASDTWKPQVVITAPSPGTVSNSSTINLTGTALDDFGIFKVEVSLSGVAWWMAAGTSNWTYSLLRLGAGGNTVYARATDFSGNGNVTQVFVTYNPGKAGDSAKPSLSITGPKNNARLSKDKLPMVSGTASDNIGIRNVELHVNGVNVLVTYANGFWSATNINLKEGKNTITATATDHAQNVQVVSITVTYEKVKPQPGFEGLLLGAAVAVGLAMLARKRARA
jgi:hypothetical protein